jgi:hypothetical protein
MKAHQGGKTVRDFMREVESVAKRFPDVAERQLIQIFWDSDGVEQYIRVKWLDKGPSSEDDSPKRLIKWALRFEKAKEAMDNSGIHDGMSSERNRADHSQEGIGAKAKNSSNALETDQSGRGRHRDAKASWKGAAEGKVSIGVARYADWTFSDSEDSKNPREKRGADYDTMILSCPASAPEQVCTVPGLNMNSALVSGGGYHREVLMCSCTTCSRRPDAIGRATSSSVLCTRCISFLGHFRLLDRRSYLLSSFSSGPSSSSLLFRYFYTHPFSRSFTRSFVT